MSTGTTSTTTTTPAPGVLGHRRGLSASPAPGSAAAAFPPVQSVVRNQTRVFLHYRDLYHAPADGGASPSTGGTEGAALMAAGDVELERLSADGAGLGESVAVAVPPVWAGVQNDLQGFVDAVRQKLARLQQLQAAQFLVEIDDAPGQEQARVEVATAEVARLLGETQKRVHALGALARRAGAPEEAAIVRNLQAAYAQQLAGLTQAFRAAQRGYLTSLRRRDAKFRDSFSAAAPADDDEEGLLDYEDRGFSDAQMAHMQATERDISVRDRQIRRIHRSIVELNEMTKDLAMLIVDQGTILDRIDYNIENASHETEAAVQELEHAANYQKKARAKLLVIVLLVAVLITIIILCLRIFKIF